MSSYLNTNVEWVVVGKPKCLYCDMVYELFDENFLDYLKINSADLTQEELGELRPQNAKVYPFIYKNGSFFGGYKELNKFLS